MLRLIDVYDKGIAYLIEFYWGFIDIPELLMQAKNPMVTSYTYLPSDCYSLYSADDFRRGMRCDMNTALARREAGMPLPPLISFGAEVLAEYCKLKSGSVCYFNEFYHTKFNLELHKSKMKPDEYLPENYIFIGDQMMYYLEADKITKENIIDMILCTGTAGPPYFSAFVSDYKPKLQNATNEDKRLIIDGTTLIVGGTYSSEGVIFSETARGRGELIKALKNTGVPFEEDRA